MVSGWNENINKIDVYKIYYWYNNIFIYCFIFVVVYFLFMYMVSCYCLLLFIIY